MSTAFHIRMDGSQETPPIASAASGVGVAIFDSVNNTLEYTINVTGLDFGPFTGQPAQTATPTDDVNNAHFHAQVRGIAGPVVFDWKIHDTDDFTATLQPDGSWLVT